MHCDPCGIWSDQRLLLLVVRYHLNNTTPAGEKDKVSQPNCPQSSSTSSAVKVTSLFVKMSKTTYEVTHTYYYDWEEDERRLTLTDDEVGHGYSDGTRPWELEAKPSCWSRTKTFLNAYALPLGLLTFVVFGALVPQPGVAISHQATSYVCVIGIFFYSGLFLKTEEMKAALKGYRATIWGIVSILFVTSLVGTKLTDLVKFEEISTKHNSTAEGGKSELFGPREFKTGFQLFFVVPCTISSGVLMVNQLGGNYALAVLLTVVTNVVGIFTVPPMMSWLLSSSTEVKLDVVGMLTKMLLTLLLPLLVGKALQYIKKFYEFGKKIKPVLRIISIFLLVCLAFMKISQASASGSLGKLTAIQLVLIICWNWTIHIVFLVINRLLSFIIRLNVEETKCIVILASQKSLAIGIAIVGYLPKAFGDQGLITIPLVLCHLSMILFDAGLISIWLKFSPIPEEDEEKAPLLTNVAIPGYTEPDFGPPMEKGDTELVKSTGSIN
eukprot:gene18973-20880_t